ncbi:MAG: hypothetical protein JW724_03225 [Candidatus Altiarchaeota archaeon]|nr:hypothetical protein [Candidatus Altiarchaeota archaeon]
MLWDYVDGHYKAKAGFDPSENWGDHTKVSGLLLLLLYAIRNITGWPMIVHCAYEQAGHNPTGQHPLGNAVDIHFLQRQTPKDFYDQILTMETVLKGLQAWDRVGIGIYPGWACPGFHLDVRGDHASWGWTGETNEHGQKVYVGYGEAKEFARRLKLSMGGER